MENKPVINIVGTRCKPEVEEKFNKWYDEIHIPLLFKFPGMTGVKRWKLLTGDGEYPEYLAIYEFENRGAYEAFQTSPEREVAMKEMEETWKEGKFEVIWRVQYESLKTWQR